MRARLPASLVAAYERANAAFKLANDHALSSAPDDHGLSVWLEEQQRLDDLKSEAGAYLLGTLDFLVEEDRRS